MAKTELETLRKLKEYYDLGSEVLARSIGLDGKDARTATRLVAEEKGERYQEGNRAKTFTELFPQEEFVQLYQLRRSDGKPLGWGHVVQVLSVRDKAQRWKLLKQAAKENWTTRKLYDAAKGQVSNKRYRGGGRFKLSGTIDGAIEDILKRCGDWLRWYKQLESPYEGEISLDELPLELRKCMGPVQRAVQRLKDESAATRMKIPKKEK